MSTVSIVWDTGDWRDCFHQNPPEHPERHTMAKMHAIAIKGRRCDIMWGVVNPGNALCAGVFRRKVDADAYRRAHASACVVVKVVVTPIYTKVGRCES